MAKRKGTELAVATKQSSPLDLVGPALSLAGAVHPALRFLPWIPIIGDVIDMLFDVSKTDPEEPKSRDLERERDEAREEVKRLRALLQRERSLNFKHRRHKRRLRLVIRWLMGLSIGLTVALVYQLGNR